MNLCDEASVLLASNSNVVLYFAGLTLILHAARLRTEGKDQGVDIFRSAAEFNVPRSGRGSYF